MSDMNLLLFGILVFGLMLTGMVLTVVEFNRLSKEEASGSDPQPESDGSSNKAQNSD